MIAGVPDVVRGEVTRLLSTRLPGRTVVTATLVGFLLTGLISAIGPERASPPMPGLDTALGASTVLGVTGFTLFVPALIGTIAVTGEYRHQTVATTFLLVPRRGRVLAAKLVVHAVLGAAYGLALGIAATAGIYAGAALRQVPVGLPLGELAGLAARVGVAAAIYMLIGVGIGALARHQLVAVGITLGYFYVLEYVLMLIPGVNAAYPFLPGGATAALTRSTVLSEMITTELGGAGPQPGPPLAGALVLLGYAVLAAVVATAVPLRRDVL